MMLLLTFLWCNFIPQRLQLSRSSYAPLAIWEINWRFDYDLCDQVVICLFSEWIAMDLCARESTDGDLGDHGDQLEIDRGIDTKIEVIVASPTTWEAHHSPRAKPECCGELPRSLVTQQWPKWRYQFLFYHDETKSITNKQKNAR